MRVVVTGASGNLGTALLRRLPAHVDVVGVVRRTPPAVEPYRRARWVSLDVAAPQAADRLAALLDGADAVVHLAWGFQPSRRPARLRSIGVGGTRAVIDAVRASGVPHLVHLSSVGAYSPGHGHRVAEDWPTSGIETSPYSRHKVTAERDLDSFEHEVLAQGGGIVVTRIRPGFVLQRSAGSSLARYGLPEWLPSRLLAHVPVLPLDRALTIPVVHADDVADGLVRVLEHRPPGAINLMGEPPITREHMAEALSARPVHVPSSQLRAVLSASWRARLQPLDPGWLDLAMTVPLLDTSRARTMLGWRPAVDARSALTETLQGVVESAGIASPVLESRPAREKLRRRIRSGSSSTRTFT